MSVLKPFRNVSNMQFIATAISLYKNTILFIIKLGNKYTKVLEVTLLNTAVQLVNSVLLANSIRVVDDETYKERRNAFKDARHLTHTLGIQLGVVLDLSIEHDVNDKVKNIEKVCQRIGEGLEDELRLLEGIMASDYRKYKAMKNCDKDDD